jgi:uncharacterized protein (DUF4415 family)
MRKSKDVIYSNLKRLDAHIIQPHEYVEAPELTDEQLAAADLHEGGKLIRRGRGRPRSPQRKTAIKFRLDPDIVNALRASGRGWMTLVNDMLRKAVLEAEPHRVLKMAPRAAAPAPRKIAAKRAVAKCKPAKSRA